MECLLLEKKEEKKDRDEENKDNFPKEHVIEKCPTCWKGLIFLATEAGISFSHYSGYIKSWD